MTGSPPFDQHRFVLDMHGTRGAVRPDRRDAEQRVEVEAGQRAGLGAKADIALVQDRLQDHGHKQREREQRQDEEVRRRREPEEAKDRGCQDGQRANGLRYGRRELTQRVQSMAPLSHV